MVVKVFMKTAYISAHAPVGSVRISLQPPMATCATGKHTQLCDPDYPNYKFNFTSPFELPYCSSEDIATSHQPHESCGKMGGQCRCRYRDATDVVYPVTGGNPFFIATRFTETNQSRSHRCNFDGQHGKPEDWVRPPPPPTL